MFHFLQKDTTFNYLTIVNLKVVGSVFLEKTVIKNVHFLRMAVTVSPYAHVAIIIVTMCLGVNVQYQVIYIYEHSVLIFIQFCFIYILSLNGDYF